MWRRAHGSVPTVVDASLFTATTITTSSNVQLTTAQQGLVRINPGNSNLVVKLPPPIAGINQQFLLRNIADLTSNTGVLTIETSTGGALPKGGALQPGMYGNYVMLGTTVNGEYY